MPLHRLAVLCLDRSPQCGFRSGRCQGLAHVHALSAAGTAPGAMAADHCARSPALPPVHRLSRAHMRHKSAMRAPLPHHRAYGSLNHGGSTELSWGGNTESGKTERIEVVVA